MTLGKQVDVKHHLRVVGAVLFPVEYRVFPARKVFGIVPVAIVEVRDSFIILFDTALELFEEFLLQGFGMFHHCISIIILSVEPVKHLHGLGIRCFRIFLFIAQAHPEVVVDSFVTVAFNDERNFFSHRRLGFPAA
ncbi:MAG: hypothetical protein BWY89_01983 [Bacteroidetes bacterium ADurb.BinA012]|nr:MAG: hypothetical protein BWY89_01983 [Bacteroidetes bacterium ADurb.BinA012]